MKFKIKKAVSAAALLLLLALLFTACGPAAGGGDGTGGETGGASFAATEAGETEADPEDAEFDENGFKIFPVDNYIKDPKFDTDEYLPDYDAPLTFAQLGNSFSQTVCETEDGWYSDISDHNDDSPWNSLIVYTDKKTGISLPLCGKPDCMHGKDPDCNAYVGGSDRLQIYDGKLYSIADTKVYRMELDGTKREQVGNVSGSIMSTLSSDPFMQIHRGYIYSFSAKNEVKNGKTVQSVALIAQELGGNETFYVFKKEFQISFDLRINVRCLGNYLYIMVYHSDIQTGAYDDDLARYADLYRWNIKTRQGEVLWNEPYMGRVVPTRFDFLPVPGDGIYLGMSQYGMLEVNGESKPWDSRRGVYKYSFETKRMEEVFWFDEDLGEFLTEEPSGTIELPIIQFTTNGALFVDMDKTTLCDLTGKNIKEFDIRVNYAGCTDDYMLFEHLGKSGDTEQAYYYAVPFGDGEEIKIGYYEGS